MNEDSSSKVEERGLWGGWVEFILSSIGYAVGIGNIWRFPYKTYNNGGGAFLIPYGLILFLVGLPVFYMEMALGQYSSLGPITMWKLCPLFQGLGWGMSIVSFIISIYYNVIIAWIIYYLFLSVTNSLPWESCNNNWNTASCNIPLIECNNRGRVMDGHICVDPSVANKTSVINNKVTWVNPAEEFWMNQMLHDSGSMNEAEGILWPQFFSLVIAWIVLFLCLFKGIKSSGKVVYVTVTLPYMMLIILLFRGLTLEGMGIGLEFYLKPDFTLLKDFKVWGAAANQIFYSLGLGFGGLHMMASYNKFKNNILRDALIISLVNCGTSVFAGFVVFSVMGFLAHSTGVEVDEAIEDGIGLAFIAYPAAVSRMPISPVWAIAFFIMMLTVGLDSQFAMFETVITALMDEWPHLRRHKLRTNIVLIAVCFTLGIPMVTQSGLYWFNLYDTYSAWYSLMLIVITEVLVIVYVYGSNRLSVDIETMLGSSPGLYWRICWQVVTPSALLAIIIFNMSQYANYNFPTWAEVIGWLMIILGYAPVPIVAIYKLCTTDGSLKERLAFNLKPHKSWGPANEEDRIRNNELIIKHLGKHYITDE